MFLWEGVQSIFAAARLPANGVFLERIVAGDDVAFYHALERMSGTMKSGEKTDIWVRATSCLKKIHGRWLIVHDHLSVPADFETGKAAMYLKP